MSGLKLKPDLEIRYLSHRVEKLEDENKRLKQIIPIVFRHGSEYGTDLADGNSCPDFSKVNSMLKDSGVYVQITSDNFYKPPKGTT